MFQSSRDIRLNIFTMSALVGGGQTLSGSPLEDNLSEVNASLMQDRAIWLFAFIATTPTSFQLTLLLIFTFIQCIVPFLHIFGSPFRHYIHPIFIFFICTYFHLLPITTTSGSCIALIAWVAQSSDKAFLFLKYLDVSRCVSWCIPMYPFPSIHGLSLSITIMVS